jgi:hypothetical protein
MIGSASVGEYQLRPRLQVELRERLPSAKELAAVVREIIPRAD